MSHDHSPYGRVRSPAELGRAVRARRQQSGAKQAEAAQLAGVGQRFLSELERGKESASLGLALAVLERFGLDVYVVPRGTPLAAFDATAPPPDDGETR